MNPSLQAEVEARLEKVRQAKIAASQRGELGGLSLAELDKVLPPVACLRTRLRDAGLSYREYRRRAKPERGGL